MTAVPLTDQQLAGIRAQLDAALSNAGAFCGECGFEPGETGCPDCVRVRAQYVDAVMPLIDRQERQPLTAITINTRKPGKWRFVDTETGEVWVRNAEHGGFRLVDTVPASGELIDQQFRDRIAAAFELLDARQWGYDHGFCEKYGVDPETDSFVDAAIAAVQPELDRLRADLAFEQKRVAYWQECRDNYAAENKRLIGEKKQLRAELEQARQQTEAAHCRLHFIAERVGRLDISDDPTGDAGDVGPYLDGPLHPLDLANYPNAQGADCG